MCFLNCIVRYYLLDFSPFTSSLLFSFCGYAVFVFIVAVVKLMNLYFI